MTTQRTQGFQSARMCPAARDEKGRILVLTVGYVMVALLMASVMIAVTALYLEHKKLLSLADGAALAAADSYVVGDIGSGISPSPTLADNRVRDETDAFLQAAGAYAGHDRLAIASGTGGDPGGTAVVVLTSVAHPPVVSFLLPDGIVVEAKSTARSRLTQ
ncbi:pilus assembly protein TadG-related protein [Paenarthrobacter sp. S56]|uniref:pilus assembly protein TadG-related protein n=1 Tax=Paenarthrobacter sp. S56 TaxID=3138179 RepID=UPI0032190C32